MTSIVPLSSANNTKLQALLFAIESGNMRDLKRLLTLYGYTHVLQLKSPSGSTPLHKAAIRGDTDIMVLLLSYGIIEINRLEDSTIGGYGAIHICCQKNFPKCLEAIILAGGDINLRARSKIAETPLHVCCKLGMESCARLLVAAGADVNSSDGFGHSPSFWAYSMRHMEMINNLGLPPPRAATAAEHLAATGVSAPSVKKKGKKGVKGKGKRK
jgi:ankyrin repeat protein